MKLTGGLVASEGNIGKFAENIATTDLYNKSSASAIGVSAGLNLTTMGAKAGYNYMNK